MESVSVKTKQKNMSKLSKKKFVDFNFMKHGNFDS